MFWLVRIWEENTNTVTENYLSFNDPLRGLRTIWPCSPHGVIGQWTVPKSTGREQMTAEVREERDDSRGRIKILWLQKRRDNHDPDCELMIDAAAISTLLLKVTQEGEKPVV